MIRKRVSLASIKVKNRKPSRKEVILENSSSSCKTIIDVYKEFANESTIHGIKYTAHAKTIFERFFWAIIMVLSIVAASNLANKFYEKHHSGNMRTLVVTNQYPSWMVELPAMTFCHSNIAAMHRIDQYLDDYKNLRFPDGLAPKDFKESLQYIREAFVSSGLFPAELDKIHSTLVMNNITLTELFSIVSPECSDFMAVCQFEDKFNDCDTVLSKTLTPYGSCCSFNYAYINGERRWKSIEDINSFFFGDNFIFSVLIKPYNDTDRASSGLFGNGIIVIIHERYTYPGPLAQIFVANMGNELVASLYGSRLTISPDVRSLPVAERECFVSKSKTDIYRADNCFAECRERKIKKLCGCVPFYASIIEPSDIVCDLTHVSCLSDAKVGVGALGLWDKECNCLPDCEGTTFQVVTTSLPFNAPQFNPSRFYTTALKYPNSTAIHITYAGQSFMLQRRELVLSWINLVSSLGGVFSLFLGCSFISIFEVFYFIGYLIWKLTCKRRRRNRMQRK